MPYVHFVPNPNFEDHNSLGYRGDEFTIEKPENIFRIVAIGESTTYGFGVNYSLAYPARLQEILHTDYGYNNVEVINGGVIGYTSYEVLTNFQFRILELDPDLIIYYGALNDADTRFEDPAVSMIRHPCMVYPPCVAYGVPISLTCPTQHYIVTLR